jgi:hypothetical protein
VEQQRGHLDLLGNLLKARRYHPAFGSIKELYDKTRAATRRQLQHFLNMMLLPTLGYGYHKVDLHFSNPFIPSR